MSEWKTIDSVPKDRYVLLFSPHAPDWDGNMEVGRWYGEGDHGQFWSCGGPNGGLEIGGPDAPGHHGGDFTHWMELPAPPLARGDVMMSGEKVYRAGGDIHSYGAACGSAKSFGSGGLPSVPAVLIVSTLELALASIGGACREVIIEPSDGSSRQRLILEDL